MLTYNQKRDLNNKIITTDTRTIKTIQINHNTYSIRVLKNLIKTFDSIALFEIRVNDEIENKGSILMTWKNGYARLLPMEGKC